MDYPQNWPSLISDILDKLKKSASQEEVYACLVFIRSIITIYQFLIGEKREPLKYIIGQLFPFLEHLAGKQLQEWGEGSSVIMKLILKILYSTCYLQIEEYFKQNQLNNWMVLLKTILDRPIDNSLLTQTTDWDEINDRSKNPDWRIKTLCMEIVCKWSHHSTLEKRESDLVKTIKQTFLDNYCLGLLDSSFNLLKGSKTNFVPPKLITYSLRSIAYSLSCEAVLEKMRSSLEMLLLDHCIPLLALNAKDYELWETDPVQFVYSENMLGDDQQIMKGASKYLINKLLMFNAPDEEGLAVKLINFMAFCFRDKKNPRSGEELTPQAKETILHIFEVSSKHFYNEENIVEKLELLIESVIFPELEAKQPILRARACSIISRYGVVEFSKKENYQVVCKALCRNLVHPHLCVRVKAAIALNTIMSHEEVKVLVRDDLQTILKSILELMNQIDLNSLVNALEGITVDFADCIEPYAIDLITQLTQSFMNYKKNAAAQANESKGIFANIDENAGESSLAAEMCLDAITNILKNAKLSLGVYQQVAPKVLELLNLSLLSASPYSVEKCLSFLNIVLYKSTGLSDDLVFYYPILTYLITGVPKEKELKLDVSKISETYQQILRVIPAFEKEEVAFEYMIGCFLNYISKMGAAFLTAVDIYGQNFVDLLFELIRKIGSGSLISNVDLDLCFALRLVIGFIENFRGKIDHAIPKIMDLLIELMKEKRTQSLKRMLLQVVCMMFWYNPHLAMKILVERNLVQETLQAWFGNIQSFSSNLEKERELYGLAGLISLPDNMFPNVIYISNQFLVLEHRCRRQASL